METRPSTFSAAFFAPVPSCGETQCSNRGACMVPPGGVSGVVCNCNLGYEGDFCEKTINGALSVPLTLSVLGVITGLFILAFVSAKLQQKKKKQHRRNVEAKHDYNIAV